MASGAGSVAPPSPPAVRLVGAPSGAGAGTGYVPILPASIIDPASIDFDARFKREVAVVALTVPGKDTQRCAWRQLAMATHWREIGNDLCLVVPAVHRRTHILAHGRSHRLILIVHVNCVVCIRVVSPGGGRAHGPG
jgi:hypothetical protein